MKKLIVLLLMPIAILLFSAHTAALELFPQCDSKTTSSEACKDKSETQTHSNNSLYGSRGIVSTVVRIYSIGTGIVAVIMIIVGGYKYISASGDPSNIKSAKNTILFAVIGLGIATIAASILQFVLLRL